MKPLTLNKQFLLPTFQQSNVAKAFHIQANKNTHCFVLTTQIKDQQGESEENYHIFFIEGKSKKIYDYELCVDNMTFERNLFIVLNRRTVSYFFKNICHHGYGYVSESTLSIEEILGRHKLENILGDVKNQLAANIIDDLRLLHLSIIPRVYNWLAEVKGEAYLNRRRALFDYPILLVPILSPLITETIPKFEFEKVEYRDDQITSQIITQAIDAGHQIESVLAETLNIPEYQLPAIKGKRFWEVSETNQPFSYSSFAEQIQSYETISQL